MCCVQNDHVCVAVRNDWKMVVTALWVEHNDDIGMPIDVALVLLEIHGCWKPILFL